MLHILTLIFLLFLKSQNVISFSRVPAYRKIENLLISQIMEAIS